ncbi:tau 95 subunit of transcription factor TFIIIC [Clavispora lusitaniae]|nr:tau 95 subunit of transcription factor TFIIIC [Clavispora lusitaniae]
MSREQAKKYSLDVSHVASVELPLIVKNTDKAIAMLGGQDRIKKALDSQFRQLPIQPSSHSVDDRNLQLRLRDDPFHHPIQASLNRREKILLKVSIPKSSLPPDYKENPHKYTIQELVKRNAEENIAPHRVEPVAVINKNYTFRAIADFQMTTKNNSRVQDFRKNVLAVRDFNDMRTYYEEKLNVKDEFKDTSIYENKDHHLIPPPNFSGIRFPFDFKYQKSPYTVTLRDENGNVKVVMKSDSKKLFTNTVDFYSDSVPQQPLPEIVKKYNWLLKSDLSQEYSDKKLFDCIQHLNHLFEVKPIWLRKSLIDVTPEHLQTAVKEALPYVSYCYKNGPWRFCNVKLGVNPKDDKSYWMYQSEYFRLQRSHARNERAESTTKIVPNTIKMFHPDSDIKLSENLFFTGTKLPKAINYQLGDIMDKDVTNLIEKAQAATPSEFFRDTIDPQDGWIKRQVLETIRRIIRYKLRCLQGDQAVDPEKLRKIMEADYAEKENEEEEEDDDEENQDVEMADEDDFEDTLGKDIKEEEDEADENDIDEDAIDSGTFNEESVFTRIKEVDENTAAKLNALVGLVKQDDLNE